MYIDYLLINTGTYISDMVLNMTTMGEEYFKERNQCCGSWSNTDPYGVQQFYGSGHLFRLRINKKFYEGRNKLLFYFWDLQGTDTHMTVWAYIKTFKKIEYRYLSASCGLFWYNRLFASLANLKKHILRKGNSFDKKNYLLHLEKTKFELK